MTNSRRTNSFLHVAIALVAGFSAACGGGNDEDAVIIDASSFIGSWRNTSGTMTITCAEDPDNPISMSTSGETMLIEAGTDSDLKIAEEDCVSYLNIDGTTARLISPTTCTTTDDSGTLSITLQAYSLTTRDGRTATESGSGAVATIGGVELHCGVALNGTLEKL